MRTSAMDARGRIGTSGKKWPSLPFLYVGERPNRCKDVRDSHGLIPLAFFLSRSAVGADGLGNRAVVYVRGDLDDSQDFFHSADAIPSVEWVSPEEVFAWIMAEHETERLDGVTFSGCDPFACAAVLNVLAALVGEAGLSLAVVSDASWQALARATDPTVTALLNQVDLLKCKRDTGKWSAGEVRGGRSLAWEVRQLSNRLPVARRAAPAFGAAA
jgi:hypothetical protein